MYHDGVLNGVELGHISTKDEYVYNRSLSKHFPTDYYPKGGVFLLSDLYNVRNANRLDFTLNNEATKNKVIEDKKPIEHALNVVWKQLRAIGRRDRTIESYTYIFTDFTEKAGIKYIEEIDVNTIYEYFEMTDVSLSTKLIRLKTIKAVLSRFYDNGWFSSRFWTSIQIIVDTDVKEGADESDITLLLNLIDKSSFTGLRDAAAILLIYRTGIRINTLGKLRESHVNIDDKELALDGSVQKNRSLLRLPLDEQLTNILTVLMAENDKVREYYGEDNDSVFITFRGVSVINSKSNTNAISKALSKYAKKYDLKNINAHALRRAYAKNLLNQGANIALISKALGHKDLATTTQYLHLDDKEVLDSLRDYM